MGNGRKTSGSNRNIRGGSWNNNANNARCGNENWNNPDNENNMIDELADGLFRYGFDDPNTGDGLGNDIESLIRPGD